MSSEARQPGMAGHEPVCGWQDEIAVWLAASPELAPGELAPEQVIAWLRGPEGEAWSARHQLPVRHDSASGMFASVLPDPAGGHHPAKWPRPFPRNLL